MAHSSNEYMREYKRKRRLKLKYEKAKAFIKTYEEAQLIDKLSC